MNGDRLKNAVLICPNTPPMLEAHFAIPMIGAALVSVNIRLSRVAVIAAPDEKWGEVPKAFLMLKPDAKTDEQTLANYCKENLARFKVPKHIAFGKLPKTTTGKIQKFKLREKEWKGVRRRI